MNRRFLCILTLTLPACAPKDPSDTDTTATSDATMSTTAPTTGPAPEVCACVDDAAVADTYICDLGPCGQVVVTCDVLQGMDTPGCENVGGIFSVDEAALDCSLDRLIAGTEGPVSFTIDSNGPGKGGGFAHVLPGRQALVRFWEFYDLSGTVRNAGIVALKDAAYFQGCKDMTDVAQKYKCFRAWNDGDVPADCDSERTWDDF